MAINTVLRSPLFVITQTVPPLLMFYVVFGRFDIGTSLIVIPPLLFSLFRIVKLSYKKQFHLLLRPSLTAFLGMVFIAMGNYYSIQSVEYVRQLARTMHEQCNRDGICKLPVGDWRVADGYPTLFRSYTTGLVPMRLVLTFNEFEPGKNVGCDCPITKPGSPSSCLTKTVSFTSFHLLRQLEDHNYGAYGGVGRTLNISD